MTAPQAVGRTWKTEGIPRNSHLVAVLGCLVLCPWLPPPPVQGETAKQVDKKMGSRFELTAVAESADQAERALAAAWAEIDRLERMISSWDPESVTAEINRQAGGEWTTVPEELLGLIERSLKVSKLTDGAFDLSFGPVGALWDMKAARPVLPSPADVARALQRVGYERIQVDRQRSRVRLADSGMRIGFGSIGKGFAANRAVQVLKRHGVVSGVANAGGDLLAFGNREDGTPFTVGIADPMMPDSIFAVLPVTNQAVVTSGDYESFVTIDGKRYSHIFDPRTGYPVSSESSPRSVTIVSPDAELADALATAVFVLGPQDGMALVNRLKNTEALIVDHSGQLIFSNNLEQQLASPLRRKEASP